MFTIVESITIMLVLVKGRGGLWDLLPFYLGRITWTECRALSSFVATVQTQPLTYCCVSGF